MRVLELTLLATLPLQQQSLYVLRRVFPGVPVEGLLPPPPLPAALANDQLRHDPLVMSQQHPGVSRLGNLGGWTARAYEPVSPFPQEPTSVLPKDGIGVMAERGAGGARPPASVRWNGRGGALLPH